MYAQELMKKKKILLKQQRQQQKQPPAHMSEANDKFFYILSREKISLNFDINDMIHRVPSV